MKKLLFILTLVLGTGLNANSQSFGIKGGINFSSTKDSEIRPGFTGGGFITKELNKVFSINGEVLYTNYNYDIKNTNITDPSGGKVLSNFTHYNFSKIEVPIFVSAKTKTGVIKPYASLGVSTGFNISGKYKQDEFPGSPERTGKLTNLNTLNVSLLPSIGFEIKEHIILDARYNVGLSNQFNDSDIKVNTFYLTLGYKF